MTEASPGVADVLAAVLALLGGYLVGSISLDRRLARVAGVTAEAVADVAGPSAVWRLAGPGWGMLALVGEVAKGVVPVAIGLVTWSWAIGWAAGLGAVLGACWPGAVRRPAGARPRTAGGSDIAVLAGAAVALMPAAAVTALAVGLVVAAVGRLLGRDGMGAAVVAGLGALVLLAAVLDPDPVRVGALLVLSAIVGVHRFTTRGR